MNHQIEVEVREKIKGNFNALTEEFHKKAKFIQEKNRFSLIYFREKVMRDISDMKNEKVDLKLRVTNKKAELVMKYGSWGGNDSRKEILIPIELHDFEKVTEFLKYLGWGCGVIMATKTHVFEYKGIEFALVSARGLNYFEAEKLTANKSQIKGLTKEIQSACKEFKLQQFTQEQFISELNKLNNAPGAKFDFKKHNLKKIKKDYKEFF